jgi:hypothetical protein
MGPRRTARALFAVACVLLSIRGLLAADPPLKWEGPACGESGESFRRYLAALLTAEERKDLRARVEATEGAGGIRLVLSLELPRGGRGDRTFTAATCALAAETAALIVAMAAYPERTFAPPAPDAGVPASPAPPEPDGLDAGRVSADASTPRALTDAAPTLAAGTRDAGDAGVPVPAAPRSFDFRVGVLPTVQWGTLPTAAPGVALELGMGFGPRWSFGLVAALGPSQRRDFGEGKGADLQLVPLSARGCFAPVLAGVFRLDGCLVAQLLWVRGAGSGFDVNHDGDLLSLSPGAALDVALRPFRWGEWRATGELSVPLSRARFRVDGNPATDPAFATLTLRTGPVFHF